MHAVLQYEYAPDMISFDFSVLSFVWSTPFYSPIAQKDEDYIEK